MRGAALALLVLASAPAEAAGEFPGFLQLVASRTLLAKSEAVTINAGLLERGGGRVWFRGQFSRQWQDVPRQRWTTGEACPAALSTLRELHRMEMPRPLLPLPGNDANGEIVLDGRVYTLAVSSGIVERQSTGELRFSTNVNTPLARWSERLIAELQPCWQSSLPPELDHDAGSAVAVPY